MDYQVGYPLHCRPYIDSPRLLVFVLRVDSVMHGAAHVVALLPLSSKRRYSHSFSRLLHLIQLVLLRVFDGLGAGLHGQDGVLPALLRHRCLLVEVRRD